MNISSSEPPPKKHKKLKKEKRDREKYDGTPGSRLKLILKVGGSSTPEHSDSPGPSMSLLNVPGDGEDSQHSQNSQQSSLSVSYSHIKKAKKKEKKKKKDKKHKHHHKEKKKKDRSGNGIEEFKKEIITPVLLPVEPIRIDTGCLEYPDLSEKKLFNPEDMEMDDGNTTMTAAGSSREARLCAIKQRSEKQPLQKLLEHLYRTLEKKDTQHFFSWPVTDSIAPGYSSIIKTPMDFSTMKSKLDDGQYNTLMEFGDDFALMCNNAMTYNQPETIYYKAAKKLFQTGMRILAPEKIRALLPLIPSIQNLSEESIGFPLVPQPISNDSMNVDITLPEEDDPELTSLTPVQSEHYMPPHPFDPPDLNGEFADDLTAKEILQQARLAAREASHKLNSKVPSNKMGFLRQRPDGTTSLTVLTNSLGVTPGTQEQPVLLGSLSGKLTAGTTHIQGARDDKRNLQRSMKPLIYGAFSSYAPHHDSTFAGLTEEEATLVRNTYGEDSNAKYAESMLEFTKGCDYAIHMVDEILNALTRGEHSKTVNYIEEQKKLQEEVQRARKLQEDLQNEWNIIDSLNLTPGYTEDVTIEPKTEPIDFDAIKSLSEYGIDTSFVDKFHEEYKQSVSLKLQENAELLNNLGQLQRERLSQPSQPAPPHVPQISNEELSVADKVIENLITLASKANPGDVAPVEALRKSMGVAPHLIVHADDSNTITTTTAPATPPNTTTEITAETLPSPIKEEPISQIEIPSTSSNTFISAPVIPMES